MIEIVADGARQEERLVGGEPREVRQSDEERAEAEREDQRSRVPSVAASIFGPSRA